jgi:hypothetical protein
VIAPNNPQVNVVPRNRVGQEKWVPVLASEYERGEENMSTPLSLLWALIVWKSQGLTIKGLLACFWATMKKNMV